MKNFYSTKIIAILVTGVSGSDRTEACSRLSVGEGVPLEGADEGFVGDFVPVIADSGW